MNLAPVDVEHAHGDNVRRPLQVSDKGDRPSGVSSVGDQVKDDAGVAVEELDSVLHGEDRPMEWGCIVTRKMDGGYAFRALVPSLGPISN
jgi:hypothetical protein